MILAGDIGGTKTVLAVHDAQLAIVATETYPSAEHASLDEIVDRFVATHELRGITAACFGVAGPVTGGVVKTTNLPWTIVAATIAEKLGGIPVALLNDLQATALGALVLPDDAFAVLQAPTRDPHAPPLGPDDDHPTIAVIAPGTGLGEGLLVATGSRYRALPSEGGHGDFAPTTEDEIGLLRHLLAIHGDHVSYERVLSGAGLVDIYDYVRGTQGEAEPAWLTAELAGHDRAAAISKAGLAKRDAACERALGMFVELLASECSNAALRLLATGGVVLGGGIPPKILPALQDGRFIERFNRKGRFASWTRTLAVRVALEPRAALFGAAHHATVLSRVAFSTQPVASHKDARA